MNVYAIFSIWPSKNIIKIKKQIFKMNGCKEADLNYELL